MLSCGPEETEHKVKPLHARRRIATIGIRTMVHSTGDSLTLDSHRRQPPPSTPTPPGSTALMPRCGLRPTTHVANSARPSRLRARSLPCCRAQRPAASTQRCRQASRSTGSAREPAHRTDCDSALRRLPGVLRALLASVGPPDHAAQRAPEHPRQRPDPADGQALRAQLVVSLVACLSTGQSSV